MKARVAWRRQIALLVKEWPIILRASSKSCNHFRPARDAPLFLRLWRIARPKADPRGLVELVHDAASANLRAAFAGSPWFHLTAVRHVATTQALLDRGEVQSIVRLRADFAERLAHGDAPVQVIRDSVDANTARIHAGFLRGVFML